MKFVCLGDSITYGYPFGPEASWVYLAAQKTNLFLLNKGVSCETTGEMLNRFEPDVVRNQPSDLIFLGGTNDAWYKIPLKEVQNNILHLLQLAWEHQINLHLGLPIPVIGGTGDNPNLEHSLETAYHLDIYRNWMGEYAAKNHLNLIDFYTPMLDKSTLQTYPEYYIDSGHPNRKGYQVMAQTLLTYLKNHKYF